MNFAQALTALNQGKILTRDEWTPTRHENHRPFVVRRNGYPHGVSIDAATAAAVQTPEGAELVFGPYLLHSDHRRHLTPWTPNQQDLFADDWHLTGPGGS